MQSECSSFKFEIFHADSASDVILKGRSVLENSAADRTWLIGWLSMPPEHVPAKKHNNNNFFLFSNKK